MRESLVGAVAAIATVAVCGVGTALAVGDAPERRAAVNATSLPVGDGKVTTSGARRGHVFRCGPTGGGGGAFQQGPWFNDDGTFDLTAKVIVDGAVSWPQAGYSATLTAGARAITSAGLPVGGTTGSFPISPSDDAYSYDRNPNSMRAQSLTYALVAEPAKGAPRCLGAGPVGIARNGVVIFDALDAAGRDAVAWEVQDACGGHPEISGTYHYHSLPSCLTQSRARRSKLVGFALDGFPIYNGRDADGDRLTNADLDVCHGRTSKVKLDGRRQRVYHYEATREFPYTVGCFRGA